MLQCAIMLELGIGLDRTAVITDLERYLIAGSATGSMVTLE